MQLEENTHPFLRTHILPLCNSNNSQTIAIGQDNDQILLINKYDLSTNNVVQVAQKDRTASLKLTDKLLVRGGTQGTVTLWDTRHLNSGSAIHTFNRPGCKFNAVNVSEHILAGGASKRVIFWDLRKMKQRCEFTDSFNEDITGLEFSKQLPTILYACCYDGLISKFDLTQKNQEEAFAWGHKIIESPCKIQLSGNIALIQTQNQILLTLEQESLKTRFEISSIEKPMHILHSYLNSQRKVQYYTREMRNNVVQFWEQKNKLGHIHTSTEIQMLIPIAERKVIFADEHGNWFYDEVHKGKNYTKNQLNSNFMTVEEMQANINKTNEPKPCNNNGFILSKPSSLKSNSKKFKPI